MHALNRMRVLICRMADTITAERCDVVPMRKTPRAILSFALYTVSRMSFASALGGAGCVW